MYSRFPRRSEPSVQIPEHYSGCAFSPSEQPPFEKKLPPSPDPVCAQSPKKEEGEHHGQEIALTAPDHTPVSASCGGNLHDGLRSIFGGSLPFFPSGMNFEELLLIGLILLLARNDQENDVILWLALLLFGK